MTINPFNEISLQKFIFQNIGWIIGIVIGALLAAVFIGATIFLTTRRKKIKNNEDKGKYIFQYGNEV